MKLIMQSEFDNLRLNANHEYDIDTCGNKQVVKIYFNDRLICLLNPISGKLDDYAALGMIAALLIVN